MRKNLLLVFASVIVVAWCSKSWAQNTDRCAQDSRCARAEKLKRDQPNRTAKDRQSRSAEGPALPPPARHYRRQRCAAGENQATVAKTLSRSPHSP